jgi:hypothetical protein
MGISKCTEKNRTLSFRAFVGEKLARTTVLDLISHLEQISYRRCNHADAAVWKALEDGDKERQEASQVVDLGKTQEAITNNKVEVRKVEVVVVFTVESRGDNIGSQGAESTIKTENLILVKMLLES